MKVLHIISDLNPKSGGPVRSVPGLCRGLAETGVTTTLFSYSAEYKMSEPSGVEFLTGEGIGLYAIWRNTTRVMKEIKPDLLHFHGIWISSNHIAEAIARGHAIPYIISPRGMLEPWALNAKKWKKRVAMWLYQRHDLEASIALHATAESEAEQLHKLGFRQPIVIVPNGVDGPRKMPPRIRRADGKRTVLFLSRVHPKKGLMDLVKAWGALLHICKDRETSEAPVIAVAETKCSGWHVEYAGSDYGGHLTEVQTRIRELGLEEDFTYLGDLNDVEKWKAYRRADIFVLPTYSENFGIVVIEALASGIPVITTKGAPWAELKTEKCGWWIDIGTEPLKAALSEAMALTDEARQAMGENGRRLVEQKYTWPAIAEQMKTAYEWVLSGGVLPPCVRS